MAALRELETAYAEARRDPAFQAELDSLLHHYCGRPTPLYFAERLSEPDVAAGGFLLDGFPRTVVQAEALGRFATIDVAVDLQVPEDVVLERISSRRVCKSCGRIYSTEAPPTSGWTCDTCGGEVVQRDDDIPEAVAKRLAAYATDTQPTIDWYQGTGVLVAVDGLGTPDEVTARLISAIDAHLAG